MLFFARAPEVFIVDVIAPVNNRFAAVALGFLFLVPAPLIRAQGNVRFDRFVALGDGQTAGFQDGALRATSQARSWVVLLAGAARATLPLPLIGEPGVPAPSSVTGLGLLMQRPGTCDYGSFDLASGESVGRLDPTVTAANLAIPYHRIGDALDRRWNIDPDNPNDPDAFEDHVLGLPSALSGGTPRSQVETAVAANPTFTAIWLGHMDVVLPTLGGEVGNATLLSAAAFEQRLVEVIGRVSAAGSEGVVLNVPNVTSTALLVSARDLRRRTGLSNKQLRKRLGVQKTSYVLISALPTVDTIAAGQADGPLASSQILTREEVARLDEAVASYNLAIERRVRAVGWAYVDLNTLFDRYERRGVSVDGVGLFSTRFLGGLYGLDGYHLSDTGQALVATAAVTAINEHYGTSLEAPDVAAIAMADLHTCGVER